MEYNFREIEKKWQSFWDKNKTFQVSIDKAKPKYYVLDMFPYPSGAGLHVGHPLGYIATDIYSRFKRLQGFNVLHPMGYDAFGLPAEQYAVQTGQHPAITTDKNIKRYKEQLEKIGFSFDWNRELRTSDPNYYKWTQWVFIELFEHWYNNKTKKAEPISALITEFELNGNVNIDAACNQSDIFSAAEWKSMTEENKLLILLNYRLAYLADTMVNWCSKLGTVLANDEVKDGFSVRGGYPVEQKKMKQWSLRISAYAERLLEGLNRIDWSDSIKEVQRNWIGRSQGAEMKFPIKGTNEEMEIFTTRPDTAWGVTFMVLAPENDLVNKITTPDYKKDIEIYIKETKKRTERERMADAKSVSGQFTGAYAINPLTNNEIPIYISDYVLMGYGTGAIMAVPGHDSRDFKFARHFNLPVIQVVVKTDEAPSDTNTWIDSYDSKEGKMINSGFINGLDVSDAINRTIQYIEKQDIGKGKINFRLRDAIFSRQRYWGEPFPVYFKNGIPYTLPKEKLPLELPEVDSYLPTEKGEPPLGRAKNWKTDNGYPLEMSTMPGFAGSSAYYLRYMDPKNDNALVSKESNQYWRNVDLYIGGTEHATGHLVYSRFWNKFLFDIGWVCEDEPFKKMINQGMIQGRSNFVYRIKGTNKFVSYNLKDQYDSSAIHVDVNMVQNDVLDIEKFRNWNPEYKDAEFILEEGKYICGHAVEKMSKSLYNVVNPDDVIDHYGADTLRMYEMFLGPLEMSKPWDTNGIDGVHKFLKKFWRLFHDDQFNFRLSDENPVDAELKVLHKTIKKINDDIERFSFNTSVSAFMICVNELNDLKCSKREILESLIVLLSPFAPHITEELWSLCGHNNTVSFAKLPEFNESYLKESTFECPVSFNGKMRFKIELPINCSSKDAEDAVLGNENSQKWLEGKAPKKIIFVPNKIINVVI
ncbi:MAG: leucine--tRNA ligase [Bacteroidetes bacterium GWF2_33_16]|nr:MAG: leucine--tRNA ligase [Bacteroidetes bacterium GWE2_32_14]OFY03894.1 MAG: leucine--tRNA ligase [Bacteroidetes bacterium GWF2_33_16]